MLRFSPPDRSHGFTSPRRGEVDACSEAGEGRSEFQFWLREPLTPTLSPPGRGGARAAKAHIWGGIAMQIFRILLVAAVATLATLPGAASAQASRTIRVIVPYPPGGTADVMGRL